MVGINVARQPRQPVAFAVEQAKAGRVGVEERAPRLEGALQFRRDQYIVEHLAIQRTDPRRQRALGVIHPKRDQRPILVAH